MRLQSLKLHLFYFSFFILYVGTYSPHLERQAGLSKVRCLMRSPWNPAQRRHEKGNRWPGNRPPGSLHIPTIRRDAKGASWPQVASPRPFSVYTGHQIYVPRKRPLQIPMCNWYDTKGDASFGAVTNSLAASGWLFDNDALDLLWGEKHANIR